MNQEVKDFIAHYGVKGMRWGVRNERGEGVRKLTKPGRRNKDPKKREVQDLAKETESQSAPRTLDQTRTNPAARYNARDLSDVEMKAIVNRMQLDKQYQQLLAESAPKKKKSKGMQIASEVLMNVGKQQATNLLNKAVDKQISKLFEIKLDPARLEKAKGMSVGDLSSAVRKADLEKRYAGLS